MKTLDRLKHHFFILFLLTHAVVNGQQPLNGDAVTGSGWTYVGDSVFTLCNQTDFRGFDIDTSGQLFIAISDNTYSGKASVMTFNGTSWDYVGTPGFITGQARGIFLKIDPSGKPNIAYADSIQEGRISVMRFNGTDWEYIGIQGFSVGMASSINLDFDPAGVPYVAFSDEAYSNSASIMKFDGSAWAPILDPGLGYSAGWPVSFACSPAGEPCFFTNDLDGSVLMFDGTDWNYVGHPGFPLDYPFFASMAFAPNGDIYVAYCGVLEGFSGFATVMKFDGVQWDLVGEREISQRQSQYIDLAFSPSGTPFIAYKDVYYYNHATVMAFNGTQWIAVGNPGFSGGIIYGPDLAFDPKGSVYIAYPETYSTFYPCDYYLTIMRNDSVNISIEEKPGHPLSIYPNPFRQRVTISFANQTHETANITLYNLVGKKVAEQQSRKEKVQFNLEEMPSGTYLVEVKTNRSRTFGKICKY